ncbi:hypothetical protein B4915_06145 [Leucobacter massiliensis]|uniref:Toxin-antitoxin system HicB family antitoxin n=1 Tax=Leucobacter massiliensis TaxID=1686285 RepID=A0A2S9QPA7_9MICO|nr:hypothetical protein B4915_06145 [Leucobacter massiliensis]
MNHRAGSSAWAPAPPESRAPGISGAIASLVILLRGDEVRQVVADRRYSGKFVVRLTPEAHRQLALEAAEQRVSLNRLAASRLVGA